MAPGVARDQPRAGPLLVMEAMGLAVIHHLPAGQRHPQLKSTSSKYLTNPRSKSPTLAIASRRIIMKQPLTQSQTKVSVGSRSK